MNEVVLYGSVGASFWDEEFFTAKQVRDEIKGKTGPLTVRINSGGGIATEGQAIYTALRDHPGEVTVVVDGVAASAASLIAMAGDKIVMRRGAWMLIHDPAQLFGYGRGTADDHRELAGYLDAVGDAYAEVYAARSGMERDEARAIMRRETVYVGAAAVEAGFATEYEADQEAAAAAAFDYRLYAHAPRELRDASERLGVKPGQLALAAIIAGRSRTQKEAEMADPKNAASEAPTAAMTAAPVEARAETLTAAEPKPAPKPTMSASQVTRLYAVAEKGNVPNATVAKIVEEAGDFEVALERLTVAWSKLGDADTSMPGAPTARILRDERDTARAGMTEALTAQLERRAPTDDRARPFMSASVVEMAAQSVNYSGPLRSVADRENVLRMATHSTSDFPAIFENALNKTLEGRYRAATPVYRSLADRRSFNDFRPHTFVRAGDFPALDEIGEGGEIKYGTLSDNKEVVTIKPYGRAIRISRQMLVNDDLDALAQVLADRGRAVAHEEDKRFFEMMLGGSNADGPTLLETERQVFNATDLTKAGTPAAITVSSVSLGRAAIMKQATKDGSLLDIAPSILLVGPDKLTEAEQLVASINPDASGSVNPFSGRLTVVSTARIDGNAWYLFADPAAAPVFVYGFLSGFEAPRLRMDEPFGQQGMAFSVEHDFGCGAVGFRGGYKNAGS
jgi:ATP-dependent protease ClpP protease subunit